ncbi:MAG: DUF6152 family protein [Pseudomonadota bacterium]
MPRRTGLASILSATLAVLALTPVHAHHSRAAFQLDEKVSMNARVTKVRWSNPHMFLVADVVNDKGQKEEWIFEGHSISGLTRNGWMKDSVKVGDQIQLVVNRHRDPAKHFALVDHVVMADGRKFWSVGQPERLAGAPAPVIKPSTDFSGNWRYRFPGTPEQVRQRILLGPQAPAAEGPYTARAAAQVKAYNPDDNPTLRCLPTGLPSLLMTVYEYKWIRHPDRIVIEKEQLLDATRTIHLTSKAPPAGLKPSLLGYSRGHFEADGTLVVETTGFAPGPWGNGSGIDSSEQKRIVERYKLIDGGMGLSLTYTQEDPVYFTKPVVGQGVFSKTPDSNFAKNPPCDLSAARQHLAFDR